VVAEAVSDPAPGDEHEADDIAVTLRRRQRTDVFRRVRPDRHLVSYVGPVDPDTGHVLLGEHLNAWWSPDEVRAVPPGCFDPAFGRAPARSSGRSG
jgi:hypothetical protein